MNVAFSLRLAAICLATALPAHAQVPQIINYQGRVLVGSSNFNSTGQFKFSLVNTNGSTTYWSNDGTSTGGSEPTNAVPLGVSNGLYSVLLGDTAIANMTTIPVSAFNNSDVRLRVWFNDGTHGSQLLSPDQRIASVGYAVIANNVADGAITSAKIAPGAVGATQIDSSTVQKRVTGTAPEGTFIKAINPDGTLVVAGDANSGGTVTNVSANSPLVVTSGTTTPNIDLTGIVGSAHGGTGLSSAGVAGSLLQSNGAGWTSATPGFLTSEMDGVIGNEVTNATNATLARSGSGTAASPFTLRLNLGNANTWIAAQTFSAGVLTNDGTAAAPAYSFSGDAGTGMFHSAANTLNFVTGGTSRMSISSTGVISGDGSGLALGQTIYTASGTASLSVANTAPYAVIPGLTQTFTLPAASIVYIQTDGGMQTTSPSAGGFSGTDIQIFVDGLSLAGGTARLIVAVNLPDSTAGLAMIANWAIGFSVGLTPGSHTIDVRAAGAGFGGGTTATVSSGAGSLLQAKLNIIVLKQ